MKQGMKAFGILIFVVILVAPYAFRVWDDYGVIFFSLLIVETYPFHPSKALPFYSHSIKSIIKSDLVLTKENRLILARKTKRLLCSQLDR
jgi:hypothetical protein